MYGLDRLGEGVRHAVDTGTDARGTAAALFGAAVVIGRGSRPKAADKEVCISAAFATVVSGTCLSSRFPNACHKAKPLVGNEL